jgi:hypothetical protein
MSGKLTKADYPPNWAVLRAMVRVRDEDCCSCIGYCGSDHDGRCGAPNHARIVRDPGHKARWWLARDAPWSSDSATPRKVVRVVLTVAHLCQDSRCDDLTCLRALCQFCHLRYDARQHARTAARTRRQRLEALGQTRLWQEDA